MKEHVKKLVYTTPILEGFYDTYLSARERLSWYWGLIGKKPYIKRDEFLFMRAKLFHDYLCCLKKEEAESKMKNLFDGMDEQSICTAKRMIENYGYLYTHNFIEYEKFKEQDVGILKMIKKKKMEIYTDLNLPPHIFSFLEDIFYYNSGLFFVPKENLDRIVNTDFIDCGAFVGDSTLVFERLYKPNMVYAIEPVKENYDLLLKTINLSKLEKVRPIKKAVGEKQKKVRMHILGVGSYISDADTPKSEEVDTISVDGLVKENRIRPGLIKMDVEGYELHAVKGAIKTIKKYKPVLLISVYHTPTDLFEIKPLIEQSVSGYKFLIRKLVSYHPVYETMLIAYPKRF